LDAVPGLQKQAAAAIDAGGDADQIIVAVP
jgi:hypothetical protein